MASRLSFSLCTLLCMILFYAPSCGPVSSTETTTDATVSDAIFTDKAPRRESTTETNIEPLPELTLDTAPELTPTEDAGPPEALSEQRPESRPEPSPDTRLPSPIRSRWLYSIDLDHYVVDEQGVVYYSYPFPRQVSPTNGVTAIFSKKAQGWSRYYGETTCDAGPNVALYDKEHILVLGARLPRKRTDGISCASNPVTRESIRLYVAKLKKKSGDVVWSTLSEDAGKRNQFTNATVSLKDSSIFLQGIYTTKLTFGQVSLPNPKLKPERFDRFLMKLDKNGKALWIKRFYQYTRIYADSRGGFFADVDNPLKPICRYKSDGQLDWCINGHKDFWRSSNFSLCHSSQRQAHLRPISRL